MAQSDKTITVIGAGNGGLAMAATASLLGAQVAIYDVVEELVAPIEKAAGVYLEDEHGKRFSPIRIATTDIKKALENTSLVLVVTPAFAHASVAKSIAPHISPGAYVVLNPGRTGGALEVATILKQLCPEKEITVAEAQTLLYACRKTSPTEIVIKGKKSSVPLAAVPSHKTPLVLNELAAYFPAFTMAESVLETSFANIGAIFHPAPTLLNTGWIESSKGAFEYYHQGISPAVADLLEQLDKERLRVANAYGVDIPSAKEWLKAAYGIDAPTLYDAIQKNPAYAGIKAPTSPDTRYLKEDIPTGIVPISELGRLAGVKTPLMDAIVCSASFLLHADFRKTGRGISSMGANGSTKEDFISMTRQ